MILKKMFTNTHIKTLLFATDLSENAERALAYAVSMAQAYGATVHILYVIEKLPPNAELLLATFLGYNDTEELKQHGEEDLIALIKRRIRQFCQGLAKQLTECNLMLHDVLVEPGKPADRILHHLNTGAYDALVMGSRGHSLIQEALIGGTSRKVIVNSPVPVFVVPMCRRSLSDCQDGKNSN